MKGQCEWCRREEVTVYLVYKELLCENCMIDLYGLSWEEIRKIGGIEDEKED